MPPILLTPTPRTPRTATCRRSRQNRRRGRHLPLRVPRRALRRVPRRARRTGPSSAACTEPESSDSDIEEIEPPDSVVVDAQASSAASSAPSRDSPRLVVIDTSDSGGRPAVAVAAPRVSQSHVTRVGAADAAAAPLSPTAAPAAAPRGSHRVPSTRRSCRLWPSTASTRPACRRIISPSCRTITDAPTTTPSLCWRRPASLCPM